MKKSIIGIGISVLVFIGCSKNPETAMMTTVDCTGPAKSFDTYVNPIIQNYCTGPGCHGSGSSNGPGSLTTFQQIFNARGSIRSAVASGSMPRDGVLSATQQAAILCWIDNGASNN